MISSTQLLRSLVSSSRPTVPCVEIWSINSSMLSCLLCLTQVKSRKLNSASSSWTIWWNSLDLTSWDLSTSRLPNRLLNSATHKLLLWDRQLHMVSVSWQRKQVHILDKSQTTAFLALRQLLNSLCQQMSRKRRPRLSSSCMLKIMLFLLLVKLSSSRIRLSTPTLWFPTGWVFSQSRTTSKRLRFKMSFCQTFCWLTRWPYLESNTNASSRLSSFWPTSQSRNTWMNQLFPRSKLWLRISLVTPLSVPSSNLSTKISLLRSRSRDSSSSSREAFTSEML